MQRRSAVLAGRIRRQTCREHQADGAEVIISRGIRHLSRVRIDQACSEAGMFGQQILHIGFDNGNVGLLDLTAASLYGGLCHGF